MARHRNKRRTKENTEAFLEDLRKAGKAVEELSSGGKITRNLAVEMLTIIEEFALGINTRHYGEDEKIEEELTNMKTTRSLFSHEIRAEGKAEGIT